jgi:xanthine dioxygenase
MHLWQAFDPESEQYGHGNNKTEGTKKSILHPDLKTIPRVPQVQLIGNGTVYDHEGLAEAKLKHPSHTTFHKTRVSLKDEAHGATRFYRWHIDAALYGLSPPRVTTLYGLRVPAGTHQVCRYDDGSGDELPVPLGTTAFVSGRTMFEILPPELKSLAVRARVRYAPHPYVWMAPASAMPTGLGIETEGLELPLDELPPWEEEKVKIFPVVRAPAALLCTMCSYLLRSSGRTPRPRSCTSRCTRAASVSCSSTRFRLVRNGRARCTPMGHRSRISRPFVSWCTGCSVPLSRRA